MSAIGGDAAIAVDVDQDARVMREEESFGASETSPLLPTSEVVDEEPELNDNLNKPWLGSPEFDAKPWWRRPNVWYLIPPTALFTFAVGGSVVPKINLVLSIVCRDYFADQKAKDPTFTYLPVIFGEENDQCRIPQVQSNAAQILLYVNLISGFLSALVSPRLGDLSDRYGRMPLMSLCVAGTLISEVFVTFIAAYPDHASVNWLLVAAFVDGLCGSFTLALSLVHSYGADWKVLDVFLAVLVLHGIYLFTLFFLIPESLSKERQNIARTKHLAKPQEGDANFQRNFLRELHPYNIFKPLAILWPKPSPSQSSPEKRALFRKLRKNLVLIAAIDTLMFGVGLGTVQIIILYAEYVFGWGNYESSVFISVVNGGRVITLLVILPGITRLIRGPTRGNQVNSGSDWLDISLIRLAIFIDLLGYIGYAVSKTGGIFTLSALVASIGGIGPPSLQSSLTKHVPPSQTGRILGAMGLLHALARVVSPVIFNGIYSVTVGTFTQAVFVCLASVFGLAAFLSWFIIPNVHLPESLPSSPSEAEDNTTIDA
ncbi:Major facilitator superfamily domain, general substrate transporter [Penicillium occitanis (nom. inval.)]|nr:Major facilitator superfamily domain, general substrate transporter [Penicillium occitanis (nom. inval.)]PCH10022.1 hypothetical protein PENOC_005470 [Penicillium occitanis (nom. inval.)]